MMLSRETSLAFLDEMEKISAVIVGRIQSSNSTEDLRDERARIERMLLGGPDHEFMRDGPSVKQSVSMMGVTGGVVGGALYGPPGAVLGAVAGVLSSSVKPHALRTRIASIDRILEQRGKEKKAEVEYHGKTFPGYNQPITSDKKEKKMMVLAKKGGEVRLLHFGQKGYQHNYSPEAKQNYLTRSAGIRDGSGNLTKDDPLSPNYWARRVLWPKGRTGEGSNGPIRTGDAVKLEKKANILGHVATGALVGGGMGAYGAQDGNKLRGAALGAVVGGALGAPSEAIVKAIGEKALARGFPEAAGAIAAHPRMMSYGTAAGSGSKAGLVVGLGEHFLGKGNKEQEKVGSAEDKHTENIRKLLADFRKKSEKAGYPNHFAVVEHPDGGQGASTYQAKDSPGGPARTTRAAMIAWEKKHGFDPHHDSREKTAADLTLYHASTRPDLREIEPRLDPRTGEKAIFAKTYKEGTAPFALAGQSSYGNISHSTKAGKFTGGKAEVRKQLAEEGWIYEIHVPSDKAEKYSENTYLLREKAMPSAIHKITRQEAEAMGWKFEKKAGALTRNFAKLVKRNPDPGVRILSIEPAEKGKFLFHGSNQKLDMLDVSKATKRKYGYEFTVPTVFASGKPSSLFTTEPVGEHARLVSESLDAGKGYPRAYHMITQGDRRLYLGSKQGGFINVVRSDGFFKVHRQLLKGEGESQRWVDVHEYVKPGRAQVVASIPSKAFDWESVPHYEHVPALGGIETTVEEYLKHAKDPAVRKGIKDHLAKPFVPSIPAGLVPYIEKKAEYAKGLPDKKKTSPVRLVEKPEHWRMVLQHHPAMKAGAHHDLRLNDPAPGGISHSWATKKDWPKPGERIRLFQQPDHKPSYSDFQGHLLSGYGKTKPGSKGVQKVMDERVEIKRTSDKLIRFDVFRKEGELPDRYVLVKAKHDGKGHPPWVLINHGKAEPVKVASALRSRVNVTPTAAGHYLMRMGDKTIGKATMAEEGTLKGIWVDEKYHGMGLGKKFYGEVMRRQPGGELHSDSQVSGAAGRTWDSMAKSPSYEVKKSPWYHQRSVEGEDGKPEIQRTTRIPFEQREAFSSGQFTPEQTRNLSVFSGRITPKAVIKPT